MSSPKKWMRPAVGGKSPVMALNSVVLPAPFDPRMAYFCPAVTASETPSTARSAPKARVTPSRRSASPDRSCVLPPRAGWGVREAGGRSVVIVAISVPCGAMSCSFPLWGKAGMGAVPDERRAIAQAVVPPSRPSPSGGGRQSARVDHVRQSGTSRVPIPIFLNSASDRPSVCEMFGTDFTTLL